jgi:transcriptional regulator with XRE-family HTH domain
MHDAMRARTVEDWTGWMRALGRQNRAIREFLGLSQEEVARRAGVSQGAVSRLEAGRGMSTPLLVVMKVGRVLSKSMVALGPEVLRHDVHRIAALPLPLAEEIGDDAEVVSPDETDPELAELLALYGSVMPGQRRALVNLLRATSQSLTSPPNTRSAGVRVR